MMNRLAGPILLALSLALPMVAQGQEPETTGPNGEPATSADAVILSADDAARLKAGGYTAAFAWHELYDWSSAVSRGAQDEFALLGITVVAQTNAGFDAARQTADVETILTLKHRS